MGVLRKRLKDVELDSKKLEALSVVAYWYYERELKHRKPVYYDIDGYAKYERLQFSKRKDLKKKAPKVIVHETQHVFNF